jgi:uncharacterized membrane protein
MTPDELRRDWRESRDPLLMRRRAIIGLSLLNIGCTAVIAMYQTGLLRRLPDPPQLAFDSERVNGSIEAYSMLQTPDAILGLGSYAATLGLAAMGGADRRRVQPFLPLALAAKAAADVCVAGKLLSDEVTRIRAICSLCLITSLSTVVIAALTIPEARAAMDELSK